MKGDQISKIRAEVIKLISSGVDLNKTLKFILSNAEKQLEPKKMFGLIMLYDSTNDQFTETISHSLPREFLDSINSSSIGFYKSSGVTASFLKKPTTTPNIPNVSLWENYVDKANQLGLQACWSIPILSSRKELLGTFAIYYTKVNHLDSETVKLLEAYKRLASIAIQLSNKVKKYKNQNVVYSIENKKQMANKEVQCGKVLYQLNRALERGEFEIYYQPYYGINQQPMGIEALIRWNHPIKGVLTPASFLSIAEETGILLDIEKWVLFQSMLHIQKLHRKVGKHIPLSVNISAKQLANKCFPTMVSNLLKQLNYDPALLTLEITERVSKKNNDTLLRLKKLGINLSIDDFGTAYSSLQYLKELPVDEVKIDRSFISNLETDETNQKIVEMIIRLGHQLGINVVAKGVETAGQYQLLQKLGCDSVQGFLFSKPVPLNTFGDKYFTDTKMISIFGNLSKKIIFENYNIL